VDVKCKACDTATLSVTGTHNAGLCQNVPAVGNQGSKDPRISIQVTFLVGCKCPGFLKSKNPG